MAKHNGKAKPKPETAKAAYFLSLTLSNVRCFGPEQTLDLSDGNGKPARWTVLLGENGTGKTTILELLKGSDCDSGDTFHLTNLGVIANPFFRENNYWLRESARPDTNLDFDFDLAIGEQLAGDELSSETITVSIYADGRAAIRWDPRLNATGFSLKSYCYGASRSFGTIPFDDPVTEPTATLYNDRASLRNPQEWLLRIDHAAARKFGKQAFQLSSLKQILIDILPDIDDIRFETGDGPYPKPHVDFKTPYGWVPLRQLGYGYQSMITWIVDLATRLFERYPESPNPLAEPAVVLVDEIDLHLHPVWQRQLMKHLTEHFPNTQFIVTAHSPLIVQAIEDANIAVLRREGDHVVILNDLDHIRNWRIDQILTSDLFGLQTARPPYVEDLLRKRKEILSQSELTKADKKKLKELEEQIGDLPTGESAQEVKEREVIWKAIDLLNGRKTPS